MKKKAKKTLKYCRDVSLNSKEDKVLNELMKKTEKEKTISISQAKKLLFLK